MCDASSPSQIKFVKFGYSHTNVSCVSQLHTVCVAADRRLGLRTASSTRRGLYRQQKHRIAEDTVQVHTATLTASRVTGLAQLAMGVQKYLSG